MHDKPGLALDLGRVAPIIMDAVTDKDQRRIAKQHHSISMDVASPDRAGWCWTARLGHSGGARRLAVHDIVFLDQCTTCGPRDLMSNQHESQRPTGTVW